MEDRQMNNELTTQESSLVNYNPGNASLLEMRADPARFPRIKTMPRAQVVDGMTRIVTQAFLYRGQAADSTNIQFIASTLVQEFFDGDSKGATNLSLAEIQVVVKRAVLGTDMWLSVASLYKVITDFAKGDAKLNQDQVDAERARKKVRGDHPMVTAYTGAFIRNHKSK